MQARLLIEGPILARGYLNNKVKTDEVFTEYSKWARREEASSDVVRRMYKTGDRKSGLSQHF